MCSTFFSVIYPCPVWGVYNIFGSCLYFVDALFYISLCLIFFQISLQVFVLVFFCFILVITLWLFYFLSLFCPTDSIHLPPYFIPCLFGILSSHFSVVSLSALLLLFGFCLQGTFLVAVGSCFSSVVQGALSNQL